MDEQVRQGHEVAYFFSGRQYPLARGPRLHRWQNRGVAMSEVVNSPLYDHGRQPGLEVSEPRIEGMFERLLRDARPEIVHVQELAGLPSSLLDVARRARIPVIVTLQDYFPLCSTFKLFDFDGRVCLRREIGADCMATSAADPRDPGLMVDVTVAYHLERLPIVRSIDPALRDERIHRIAKAAGAREASRRGSGHKEALSPEDFQRRREINVERLNRADRVIAMSHRVAEIYAQLGVNPERLRTIQLTLEHIERLRPRQPSGDGPLTFATLAGFESVAKGARLLLEAFRALAEPAARGRFRLLVFGHVDPAFADEARALPGVEVRGIYGPERLNSILEEVDVGIMPSIWEEAYGYAGMEFLAKGIPVIANAVGGMTDYTRDGETGWLNHGCSSEGLVRIMAELIEHPERVMELAGKVATNRDSIVKPLSRHAREMDLLYGEAIATRNG